MPRHTCYGPSLAEAMAGRYDRHEENCAGCQYANRIDQQINILGRIIVVGLPIMLVAMLAAFAGGLG